MSKRKYEKNSGKRYARLYDELVEKVGLIGAALYGQILSYENGSSKSCYASQATLCGKLDINHKTCKKYLNKLHSEGYIYAVEDRIGRQIHYRCIDLNNDPIPQAPRSRQVSWDVVHPNASEISTKAAKMRKSNLDLKRSKG